MKRATGPSFNDLIDRADEEPCAECDALPGHDHASWCLAESALHEDAGWN